MLSAEPVLGVGYIRSLGVKHKIIGRNDISGEIVGNTEHEQILVTGYFNKRPWVYVGGFALGALLLGKISSVGKLREQLTGEKQHVELTDFKIRHLCFDRQSERALAGSEEGGTDNMKIAYGCKQEIVSFTVVFLM